MRLKVGAGVLVLAGALLLAACGSSGSGATSGTSSTSGASNGGTSITISNFMFDPMSLTVAPGGTVQRDQQGLGHPYPDGYRRAVQHRRHRSEPDEDVHGADEARDLPLHLQHPPVHDGLHHREVNRRARAAVTDGGNAGQNAGACRS